MLKFWVGLVGMRWPVMLTSTLDFPRFWLSGWVGVKEEIGSDMVVLLPFFEGDLDLSVSESVSEWSRLRF